VRGAEGALGPYRDPSGGPIDANLDVPGPSVSW